MKEEHGYYEREDVIMGFITLTLRLVLRILITWGVVSTLMTDFGSQLGIIGGMLISWGAYSIAMAVMSGIMTDVFGFDEGLDSSFSIIVNLMEYFGLYED